MARRIQVALLEEVGGPFVVREADIDPPRGDEILVRLTAVGICHTDLSMRGRWPEQKLPMVFGHEGTGVVEDIGELVTDIALGDTVCLTYNSCGSCSQCRQGAAAYCETPGMNSGGTRQDGTSPLSRNGKPVFAGFFGQSSFATHAMSRRANTIRVADDISPSIVAPLGCGIQTGAGAVLNVLRPGLADYVVIFGAGGVGSSALMAAVASGCRAVVVDPVARRRDLAYELGATAVLDSADRGIVAALRDLTDGGPQYVIDTTGRSDVIALGVDALRHRGELALVGIGAPATIDTMTVMAKGLTIRGVIEGDSVPSVFIPRLMDLHRSGVLPVEKLVREFPFADIEEGVKAMASGEVVKPVLVF